MRAFRLAYNGESFYGFQRQPDVPTVEGRLFDALDALDILGESKPVGYAAAGRTDRGVSAVAQTVGFECPEWCRPRALNSRLPESIRAWAAADVDDGFHATHDAIAREYTYYLHRGRTAVDPDVARDVLAELSGTHDFHNLTPDEENTVRTLEARAIVEQSFLRIELRAGGFSRQLVRRIVSLVTAIASGELPGSHVERVLAGKALSGPMGIGPAPARALVLTDVVYPEATFEIDERAAASARETVKGERVEHETRGRVAGAIERGLR